MRDVAIFYSLSEALAFQEEASEHVPSWYRLRIQYAILDSRLLLSDSSEIYMSQILTRFQSRLSSLWPVRTYDHFMGCPPRYFTWHQIAVEGDSGLINPTNTPLKTGMYLYQVSNSSFYTLFYCGMKLFAGFQSFLCLFTLGLSTWLQYSNYMM